MRLEWIEDILAVAEHGSLQAASAKRNVSQPAFSRRIRQIEEALGVTLFDRTARPARLVPHVAEQLDRMRELSAGLRDLALVLRDTEGSRHRRIVIASQHAIAATSTPEIIGRYADLDVDTRLRSANRDDCLAQLMTRRADIALIHNVAGHEGIPGSDFLEMMDIGTETLIPVYAADRLPTLNQAYARGELPVIAYPADVFLGQVQRRIIFPRLTRVGRIRPRLETALTLAALEFARTGFGVAWIPEHLANPDIRTGRLVNLRSTLPAISMTLIAARLGDTRSAILDEVWERIRTMSTPLANISTITR
ncbi:MAG: LysR family transcriptional regulator [Pseudotabrizicola sp.]|uniref:LysR family transcriptional regulator n=1 Tax=Pseudotabrizicola sp. TaxID=2939647 RepID=UPI0027191D81|nr:LysR family transcriptional regulator [Pseudotabrizicola sp.]MDO8883305.1 LysR family transcriptional regulator [Pseudotabrizicola sp.]MDP2083521.1 LysR family transcriptional regulator [Pseudotabrizicola sp.]MDZ7575040.1 LysR family transcriptional regulator [Pseudotabrizicola sp.]